MSLPTIELDTFPITIPSTKTKREFRRFTLPEEKLLLMAKQSGNGSDIADAVFKITQACNTDELDINSIKAFDLDYVFLKLRAASVDNIATIVYTDGSDKVDGEPNKHEFNINLDDVEVQGENATKVVVVSEKQGLKVKLSYPTVADVRAISEYMTKEDVDPDMLADLLTVACIESIFDDTTIHVADSTEELLAWVQRFTGKILKEIKEFVEAIPKIEHTVSYKTSKGEEKEVVIRGLKSFFTF